MSTATGLPCEIASWAGAFGDEYTRRQKVPDRSAFWRKMLALYGWKKVLEVGCGAGFNLRHIPGATGIDVNAVALQGVPNTSVASGYSIPCDNDTYDLCFTCGVLIHQPPGRLLDLLHEIVRVSRKHVMFIEYWAEEYDTIPYRGRINMLWKGPFDRIFEKAFKPVKVAEGFLRPQDGFDNCHWWLWDVS
jgi:SAM-dependent methyltransferase